MIYQRSQDIERRLAEVLRLIRTGRYSTPVLADKVGVSIPTISRCISALRKRGHRIRSVREGSTWRYLLDRTNEAARLSQTKEPQLTGSIPR